MGGGSLGFAGCDLHGGGGVESQRRFMVNATLGPAKWPGPAAGAPIPACGEEQLKANWDRKALGVKKPAAAP